VSIDRLALGTVAAIEFVPVLALFAVYIVLADRVAKRPEVSGIDGLAAAMTRRRPSGTPPRSWPGSGLGSARP
jgi:threonine/homoserine efflux transporter RhtA